MDEVERLVGLLFIISVIVSLSVASIVFYSEGKGVDNVVYKFGEGVQVKVLNVSSVEFNNVVMIDSFSKFKSVVDKTGKVLVINTPGSISFITYDEEYGVYYKFNVPSVRAWVISIKVPVLGSVHDSVVSVVYKNYYSGFVALFSLYWIISYAVTLFFSPGFLHVSEREGDDFAFLGVIVMGVFATVLILLMSALRSVV